MCGICGFTGYSNNELLNNMGNAIAHRGPDATGSYSERNINMCSRRLSIVDIEHGTQPCISDDKNIILVWNGEIYNYPELICQLKEMGHVFHSSHSDTELLLHLYEEYGLEFVSHLNGMYAIAIYDKHIDSLFLIRDRIGVKPLFYYFTGENLVFSSEIKSILIHPDYNKSINLSGIYEYFSYNNVNGPQTAFSNIFALSPATILTFHNNAITTKKYWSADFYAHCNDNTETAIHKIRELLTDAVKIRTNADVEIGSFLSGGLDSSIVTAFAIDHVKNIRTYTLNEINNFADLHNKESDIDSARMLSHNWSTRHSEYTISANDLCDSLPQIIRSFDQPFAGAMSTYFLSQFVSKDIKCILNGDGADEIFGGYLPHIVTDQLASNDNCNDKYISNLKAFSGGDESKLFYRMLQLTDDDKKILLNPDIFDEQLSSSLTFANLKNFFNNMTGNDSMNRALEYSFTLTLPNHVLSYTDALSMAHGLEIRSPFLDYRIIEYTASLHGNVKFNHHTPKYLLKEACKDILPPEIIYRKKEWFSLPIHDWMKCELKEYVTDMLSLTNLFKQDILQAENIYFLLKKYYSDPEENKNMSGIIWNIVCFMQWYNLYIES